MSRIVPKLNLNKTPQIVDNNSLMFSKNIKLLTDNTFTNDSSIENIITDNSTLGVVIGYIVGVNSKIYFFVNDDNVYKIKEYDEITKTISIIDCAWTYSGGKITGCVTSNNTGEVILTVAEYFDNEDLNLEHNVPIKHINLSRCSNTDNESIYTQHPNLPITNLSLIGYYNAPIPAGVYQFFIRYKIRKNFYTTWMPCSNELFAINQNKIHTIQGPILYNDIRKESNKAFVFQVNNLIPDNLQLYEEFQLGFIISRDNGSFARSWKHFNINDTTDNSKIIFTYSDDEVHEENIYDFITANYELFNVKNVISYKNKLFVSNYKESNFNDYTLCNNFAKNININLNVEENTNVIQEGTYINNIKIIKDNSDYYNKYEVKTRNQESLYVAITLNDTFFYIKNIGNIEGFVYSGHYEYEEYKVSNIYVIIDNNEEHEINVPGNEKIFKSTNADVARQEYENYIKETFAIVGINDNGDPIIDLNSNENNHDYHILRGYKYDCIHIKQYSGFYYEGTYNYVITPKYDIKHVTSDTNEEFETKQTLIPFTTYDFYCHFVKENGIITNGFYIDSKKIKRYATLDLTKLYDVDTNNPITIQDNQILRDYPSVDKQLSTDSLGASTYMKLVTPATIEHPETIINVYAKYSDIKELSLNSIIYPTFIPNAQLPDEYVGYFISMYKHNNNVTQGFNLVKEDNKLISFDSLEHDVSLYNNIDNILVKDFKGDTISEKGKYIPSGIANPIKEFNSLGHITLNEDNTYSGGNTVWCIGSNNSISEENKTLIKVTPFINGSESYLLNKDLNLLGFINKVSKLKKQTYNYYISGEDVYEANPEEADTNVENSINEFNIELLKVKLNSPDHSPSYIHSNFNMDCVSLSQDINTKIRSYEEGTGESVITKTQLIYTVDSLIASYILEFQSTFRNYTRRTYNEYNEDNLITFNNTIRSSNVDVDETYRNIYRFDATDYYNVPTNRGIIINLFNILNTIYIHTEHSLFKFVDNKQLTSEDGNVLLQESNVFDTGIQEVFDAQYGHGGLYKKEHSLINYEYYIFYDKLAKTIYAYNGESDLVIISDPIKKLMKHFDADDILFAGDNYNDRFFINLRRTRTINNVETIENVCLSYNLKAKSFISIHDIDFDESFNSRINTYFLQRGTPTNVFKIDNDSALRITNYSGIFKSSYLKCSDIDSYNEANNVASCIDIIYNQDYEIIKNLDYINWICKAIENYADNDYNLAEEIGFKYSGTAVRIYTDETKSEIIPLVDNNGVPLESNNQSINTTGNYQYPRYNCGIWSLNYFRDVKNRTDNFNYNEKVPLPNARALYQEDSLLYGKYFIVRFIFKNRNFKLENIKLSLKNYGKA